EMACEGYPIVLRCPGTDVIQVVTAEYGRQTAETCATSPEKMRNTACYLPQAFDIMSTKCNNQTQCKLEVSSEHFPDPCPGTHKYLHVTFSCVKYSNSPPRIKQQFVSLVFGCPGSLTGIGSNVTMDTSMQAQVGGWTKDPIYNPNRVFFVSPSQPSLQEYEDMNQFVRGDRATRIYNIHYLISGTSFVIYDGNLFFVKASSRNIIKYNLQTRIRHRESAVPGHTDRASSHRNGGNNIELAVDETGLWAIYTSTHNADRIVVSLINKNSLEIEKTWRTTYPKRSAMHTFMICGVLYVVGTRTGEVEYMYNTNLASGNGRFVAIGFDRNRPISPSDPYNPRDRLIYAWEATAGKAVYYNLHYGLPDPIEGNTITSTSTTVSTTTHERRPMVPTLGPSHPPQVPQTAPPSSSTGAGRCSAVVRDGITWPVTSQGVTRTMPCPNNMSWRCTTEQFTMRTIWDPAGPDMSRCVTWTSSIESGLVAGKSLSRGLKMSAQTADALSGDEITSSARIMSVAAARANTNSAMLTRTQVRQITEVFYYIGVTDAADTLLDSSNIATWEAMDGTQKYKAADDVINSVEAAGFILTESMANNYGRFQGATAATVVVASTSQDLVFPDPTAIQRSTTWFDITDQVTLRAGDIVQQANNGVTEIVFAAYNNLGKYMDVQLMDGDKTSTEEWSIDSRVVSASIGDPDREVQLSSPVKIVLENTQVGQRYYTLSKSPVKCVYWKYSKSQNTGVWSTEGCTVVGSNTTHTTCSCKHLTSFAVLVNVVGTKVDSWEHEMALYVVSCVGISVSLVCLIICIYTFTFFRNLQSDRNTIHKHLCISLFIAELVFLVGINQTAHKIPCAVVAGLLHYFFLAAFMWMALEGFQLYVMLVEVFEGRSRWKWYYLTGYGIPAVIVAVSAAVDPSGYGTDRACWLRVDSGFIWSFVGPVCAVILTNLIFLAITVYKMYRHTLTYTDSSKVNAVKASVRGASVLLCLLGITWAFGILWVWEQAPVMAYLFCVFNAFQGLFIFVFHCLLQKKVRNEYSRCFRHGTCCGKGSSEAYVSNSMSFSKQYTPGRYSAQSQLRRMWNETIVNGSRTSDTAVTHSQDLNTVPHR
uniref:Adhesion G protein-coupled receptor L3 n=1 Tax=Ciona savignyi TaxID=51511 RepID=H2YA38_CIOSA